MYYVGIDVGDYNQTLPAKQQMDEYIVTDPAAFAQSIRSLGMRFDAIISSHNIEHCDSPYTVIEAMCSVLKPGGSLYFTFPNADSVKFPSRAGALNFHDDPTHQYLPNWTEILKALVTSGMQVDRAIRAYRPLFYYIIGLLREPYSARRSEERRVGKECVRV